MSASKQWATKLPSEMSEEELRAAKTAITDDLEPMQAKMNVLAQANQHIDAEISTRFRLGRAPSIGLGDYPLDGVKAEYGPKD